MKISRFPLAIALSACTFSAFSEETEQPSLSYSFFGIGQERPFYQETSTDFANEAFKSEFESTALVQVSGGFTQMTPEWGFSIITTSTLLADESQEDWAFTGYGVVQQDQMTLNQNGLDIQITHMPFDHGQFLTGGIRYQKVSFSRFAFQGTGNIDALNTAIINTLDSDPNSQYSSFKADIEAEVLNSTNTDGVVDTDSGELIRDDQGNLVTTVAELDAAVSLNPELKEGVVFEDATSIMATIGYGLDSYFVSQDPGLRYRAGIQYGLPLYISVLNTDNEQSITENMPAGYDISAYAGVGYQFTKEVGLIFQYQYLKSQRDEIQRGNVRLPNNVFETDSFITQFFWAF